MSVIERSKDQFLLAISAKGDRTSVDGDGIAASFGDGRELLIHFSRHSSSRGGVMLRSTLRRTVEGPGSGEATEEARVHSGIVILPGASNVMQVSVAAYREAKRPPVADAGSASMAPSFLIIKGETRTPVDATSFVMDLGNARSLIVAPGCDEKGAHAVGLRAGPDMTTFQFLKAVAGMPTASASLVVRFGACNVVHLVVDRGDGVLASHKG